MLCEFFKGIFVGVIVGVKEPDFLDLPGLKDTVKRFKALLDASEKFDHVLIRGPRGAGKSFFLKIFKEHCHDLPSDIVHLNCASIHPSTVESELFGHVKGAFTGSEKNRKGFLSEAAGKGGVIVLEELNSLSLEIQAKLLVFMELFFFYPLGSEKRTDAQVRIVCTMNFESDLEVRLDVLDRFRVVLDVPPLHERRNDILTIIDKKFPELNVSNLTILILFAHNWPGNIRQLEQALFEYKATGSFPPDVVNTQYRDHLGDVFKRLIDNGLSEADIARNFPIYMGEILPYLRQPFRPDVVPASDAEDKKRKPADGILNFFQLIYGKHSIISEKHILSLEPFSRDSLVVIRSEKERIKENIRIVEKYFIENRLGMGTQEAIDSLLKALAACEEICAIEEANREKPVTAELTPSKVARYLLGEPENFPAVFKHMLIQKKQNRVADIIGVSNTTVNNWAKAIRKDEWPPQKAKRTK